MSSSLALVFALVCSVICSTRGATFFDTNRVVNVELKLTPDHWNELRYQHREAEFFPEEGNTRQTNSYTWFPAELMIDGQSIGKAEVRKKGYIGSNDSRRPALKLRFGHAPGKEGKVATTEVALNNNLQDSSLIRQFMAYEVFRRAGVPAPRCSFAVVKVNGKSLGIYSCVEPVNAVLLHRYFSRTDGNLYEGGRSDFRPGWFENFEMKNNQDKNDRSDLRAVTIALETTSESSLLGFLDRYFDSEEYFRFWATECLINQVDGYAANMNNFYLYHNPDSKRFLFIPWGTDSTFSRGRALNAAKGDPTSVIGVGILANRLYRSPDGAKRFQATLRKLLQDVWQEDDLVKTIDRLEKQLAPFQPTHADESSREILEVREFVKHRRADLMRELDGPIPDLKSRPLELAKRRKVGHFTAHFKALFSAENRSVAPQSAQATLSGTLWDKELTVTNVSVQASVAPAGSEGLSSIGLFAATGDGERQYFLQLAIDPDSYSAGRRIPIDNTHIRGYLAGNDRRGENGRYIGMLRGSLLLSQAARNPGAEIEGDLDVDVFSKLPKPVE